MTTKLKTIDIKGTPYVTVNSRLKYFRENYEDYQLISEVLSNEGGKCLIKASIINDKGVVIATGHGFEDEAKGFINKTSHVENCETSAWGRALGNFGIGIDAEVRSYEEMSNAIEGQKEPKKKVPKQDACADKETIKTEDIEKILFDDIDSLTDQSTLWIALTAEQQKDKTIKGLFTIRKAQLEGELKNG